MSLATAIALVHFSFEMWTSGNSLAILGVVVHLINTRETFAAIVY